MDRDSLNPECVVNKIIIFPFVLRTVISSYNCLPSFCIWNTGKISVIYSKVLPIRRIHPLEFVVRGSLSVSMPAQCHLNDHSPDMWTCTHSTHLHIRGLASNQGPANNNSNNDNLGVADIKTIQTHNRQFIPLIFRSNPWKMSQTHAPCKLQQQQFDLFIWPGSECEFQIKIIVGYTVRRVASEYFSRDHLSVTS